MSNAAESKRLFRFSGMEENERNTEMGAPNRWLIGRAFYFWNREAQSVSHASP